VREFSRDAESLFLWDSDSDSVTMIVYLRTTLEKIFLKFFYLKMQQMYRVLV